MPGNTVAQVAGRRPLTAEVRGQSQAFPCVIFGGRSVSETGSSSSTSVFFRQYHSTNAPYSYLIQVIPTLYNNLDN
jgi:hypothetical protein